MICGIDRIVLCLLVIFCDFTNGTSSWETPTEETGPRIRRVKRVYDELARLTSVGDSFVIDIGELDTNEKTRETTSVSSPIVSRRIATVLFISTVLVTVMGLVFKSSTNRDTNNSV